MMHILLPFKMIIRSASIDELRDRVAELQPKVYALEIEVAVSKGKSRWQRLRGDCMAST
jgi:hypothetical protein